MVYVAMLLRLPDRVDALQTDEPIITIKPK